MQLGSFTARAVIVLSLLLATAFGAACRSGLKKESNERYSSQEDFETRSLQSVDSLSSDALAADTSVIAAPTRISCNTIPAYKIVGGQAAIEKTQVMGATMKLLIKGSRFCSATLIGPGHLVTAAHCLVDVKSPLDLKIGSGLDGKIQDKLRIEGFLSHPNYKGIQTDSEGYANQPFYDLAVITFSGELSPNLIPVSVAYPSELQSGMPTIISGYGAYGSEDKTRRPLSFAETTLDRIYPDWMELQLKSGEGRGACFGDSGGPTFIIDSASSCLLLIGSTTGPGRNTDYSCESGGGTLMDLTRYQSWLSCAFTQLKQPLPTLLTKQASASSCEPK